MIRGNLNQAALQGGPSGSGQQPQPLMQIPLQTMMQGMLSPTTETISITNEDPLIECKDGYKAYNASNFKVYDENLLMMPFQWHRITVSAGTTSSSIPI